ncbi:MAG: tyrosine-type recombinase/integrase [Bacteroidales bacterium]|nr:tyrosine-type recombinase/integrase [Bacteroidales bacterium]
MSDIIKFISYIRVEKRYSEHTVRAYTDDISQFEEYLRKEYPSIHITEATQHHIRGWALLLLNQDISPRSLRRKISSLNTFYKYCLKQSRIARNPVPGIVLPRLEKNLPEFINETAIDNLFTSPQFKEGFPGLRDQLVLELFYATGMRLSELTGLTSASYDSRKSEIRVLGKRKKERIIPLTSRVRLLLDQYLSDREKIFPGLNHTHLIITDTGNPAYSRMIQRMVRKYLLQSTTLEKKNPHILRHTFATHMLNNGADLNAVKELLGHANLAATEIYTHNTYEKLKSIYKQAHPRA